MTVSNQPHYRFLMKSIYNNLMIGLKAHLEGHHTQNIKNVNIIVGDLIHKDVKSAVNFDKKDTTPIFSEKQDGTKQENSLEERLRKYWDIRNPLSKLRSEAFGLQSTKYETFNQWKARAKQKFSKADLDNIEGLIVLMNSMDNMLMI